MLLLQQVRCDDGLRKYWYYFCRFVAGCTKEFNRADKLKAHIIAHAGVKPHRCQKCGRTFTRRPHLREHERVHEENLRFWCKLCHQGFVRASSFKQHHCDAGSLAVGRPKQHAYRRKVGRPRKNVSLRTDLSESVGSEREASVQPIPKSLFAAHFFGG